MSRSWIATSGASRSRCIPGVRHIQEFPRFSRAPGARHTEMRPKTNLSWWLSSSTAARGLPVRPGRPQTCSRDRIEHHDDPGGP
eukprot:2027084-Pyramimonas_sp.AAC.1